MKEKIVLLLIIFFLACKNQDKKENKSNRISFDDTVEFLIHKLDRRNVELIKGSNIVEVEFKLLNKKKCEFEYSFTDDFRSNKRQITKFNLIDAEIIQAGHKPPGDYGTLNGNIMITFDKESVNYGDRWGNRMNIFTADSDVESIHRAFKNLKNMY